ncbi:MAG: DUF1501 domain-containing protein [Acidobacteria bacterium]|nr:DUF1501 domain-containing protein [Acidobacteriota bacterium]
MPTTRREFIKRSAGAVSVGLVLPSLLLSEARGQSAETDKRKLVIIQFAGGNDGLNTVIPYTDARYQALRPNLGFKDIDLQPASGISTLISNEFGLHPALSEIKSLWDQNKVAITLGVGYPNANLSHFLSMDIWHTADTTGLAGQGWLGKYADLALLGKAGLAAASIGGESPKTFYANKLVIPNIINFQFYNFLTDPGYPGDSRNQLNTFNTAATRVLPADSFLGTINRTAFESVASAQKVQAAISSYQSSVSYNPQNPLAVALQMLAQIITTMPEASLLYVQLGGFDNHASQVANNNGRVNKLAGDHYRLLRYFSEGVKTFYDDLVEHNMADEVLIMQWSEFGRRPGENASYGSDHGTVAPMFLIGNPVRGGLYGQQPSLAATALDEAGNPKFKVDFRAVYATILSRWLNAEARAVLGASYENIGFLG